MDVIGIGVDLVDVARIERILVERPRFVERVFAPEEIEHCRGQAAPARCFAARWAAREACRKALRIEEAMPWRDVRVEREASGAPRLVLEGRCRDRAAALGVTDVMVSLTHDAGVAAAFCVAVGGVSRA